MPPRWPSPPAVVFSGSGFVSDSSHPMHPGDARRYPLRLRITSWSSQDAFVLAVTDSGDTTSRPDLWYVRSGRVSSADTAGVETMDAGMGDVSASVLASIRPDLRSPREASRWTIAASKKLFFGMHSDGRYSDDKFAYTTALSRPAFDERRGDGEERIDYSLDDPETTTVRAYGRVVAQFVFHRDSVAASTGVPPPGPQHIDPENRNTIHQLAPGQVRFTELAPHLFTVDLDSLNTRVTVAEFSDSLAVIEGAFGSGVCDVLARAVQERFHKPVRVFAFSHLHGQYSGGTRSWVHEGATVVVPPTTEPLIHQMVDASFASHPDALQREPMPLRVRTVAQHLHLEDSTNALDIYNVPSGHTDEYFLFHFPRQKVLLTGDLMFLRPGKPFAGRSKQLAQTVARLGLAVDTYVASWPLSGYGTRNIVTAAEFAQAADTAAKGAAK